MGLNTLPRERPAGGRVARVRVEVLRIAVSLLVGVALLLVFLRLVDLSTVYQHLRHLNIMFALLSGGVFLSADVVRAALGTGTRGMHVRRHH